MFALDLYRKLTRPDENLAFSPYSISAALAMLHAGAGGVTRDQLERVLGVGDPIRAFEGLNRELARRSEVTDKERRHLAYREGVPADTFGCHLTVANALWHQRGYAVAPAYASALRDRLGADAQAVDFAGAPGAAARAINAWAEVATRGKIRNILKEDARPLRVVLANAIYFKALWHELFFPYETRPKPFRLIGGQRVDVPTMHLEERFEYVRDGQVQAVQLKYVQDALSMVVLLPDPGTFDEAERTLDAARLERIFRTLTNQKVNLALPKFRVEASFQLSTPLIELGLAHTFSRQADFSGIAPDFTVDDVLHMTFIDVDESGTEAAAVTRPSSFGEEFMPKPPIPFAVDRPFLFAIRDAPTNTILFLGRVVDPR